MCSIIEEQRLIAIASREAARSLPEEFERIFREHSRFIYRTAYRVTGNREDAEDVLQTLCLRMLRRELPVDFEKNPKAYLYRAAVNVALNLVSVTGAKCADGACGGSGRSCIARRVAR